MNSPVLNVSSKTKKIMVLFLIMVPAIQAFIYSPAEIDNQTDYDAEIYIFYPLCTSDHFIAPAHTKTKAKTYRGACLINGITATFIDDAGKFHQVVYSRKGVSDSKFKLFYKDGIYDIQSTEEPMFKFKE